MPNGLPKRWTHKHGAYYYVTPGNKWIRLGKEYGEALRKFADVLEGDLELKTISNLIDRYLLEVTPNKSREEQKNQESQFKRLRAFFGEAEAEQIKQQHIYQYLDARRDTPVSANRDIARLSHLFTKAIRWGAANDNPCKGVEKHREKPRDRYVSDEEFYIFYEQFCSPTLKAYLMVKYITGQRQADILNIQLSDITDSGIYFKNSKTGKKFLMEFTDELRTAVNQAKAIKHKVKCFYLFAGRAGKPYTGSGFRSIWQRAMKKFAEAGYNRFTEHDIRAKTASDTDIEHAQEIMRHNSKAFTERVYRRKVATVRPLK